MGSPSSGRHSHLGVPTQSKGRQEDQEIGHLLPVRPLVELPDEVGADLAGGGQDQKKIPTRRWSERVTEASRILPKHRGASVSAAWPPGELPDKLLDRLEVESSRRAATLCRAPGCANVPGGGYSKPIRERLFEADQGWPFLGEGIPGKSGGIPGNEQEVAVPDRHSVFLPLIEDASDRRTLWSFIFIAQDAAVFLSENAPLEAAATSTHMGFPLLVSADENVVHQVVRARQEGQRRSVVTVG